MKPKIFCIGLSKTGTSSLAIALEYMGFHVGRRQKIFKRHFPNLDLIETIREENYVDILKIVPLFDAYVDNPWPILYKTLAEKFPNAKFILTIREEEAWLKSVKAYFGNSKSAFRKITYGYESPVGYELAYLEAYRKHNLEVKEFFKNSPQRLLVLPLESNQKWELLSNFLEVESPVIAYPKVNKTHNLSLKIKPWSALGKPIYYKVIFTLLYARIMTLFFPFKKTACKMASTIPKQSQIKPNPKIMGEVIQLSKVVKSIAKKLPFRAQCFEQALALQILLKKKKIPSEIVFGLHSQKDKLAAHAWCVCNGITLSGEKGKEQFKVIKSFSNSTI